GGFPNPGMSSQYALDLGRRDVLAAANDDVLLPARNHQPATWVDDAEIARAERTVCRTSFPLVRVPHELLGAAAPHLAFVACRQSLTLLAGDTYRRTGHDLAAGRGSDG